MGLERLTMAGSMVFLGMFLDSVDGAVARLTKSVTELGAMLDSLADLVTCGVAPAMMVLALVGELSRRRWSFDCSGSRCRYALGKSSVGNRSCVRLLHCS